MYEQTSMIGPQTAEAPAPAARYYEINEETARNAHYCVHMSDYKPGSATAEYRRAVDKAAALVEAKKARVSPFYHDKLDALLDRYKLLQGQDNAEYSRWQDQVNAWQKEVAQAQDEYDKISSRDLKNYQLLLDYYMDKAAAEQKGMHFSDPEKPAVSSMGNRLSQLYGGRKSGAGY